MAVEIVSQTAAEIKPKGLDGVISQLMESTREIDRLSAEILLGSQDKALDYLSMFGFRSFLRGTDFCPAATLADFLGIDPGYLMRVLNVHGISRAKTPADVRFYDDLHLEYYISHEKRAVSKTTVQPVYVLRPVNDPHRKYGGFPVAIIVPDGVGVKNMPCLSARVALASIPLMYYGRRIPVNSIGEEIFKALMASSYYRLAIERKEKDSTQKPEEPKPQKQPDLPAIARVNGDGEITLSPEFFALLMQSAKVQA